MTDEYLRTIRVDARAAYALFETMGTDELRRLQAAHEADLAQATAPESIVFSGGRLALIAAVLRARSTGNIAATPSPVGEP